MTDGQRLLASLAEKGDQEWYDGDRLLLADWLEERGDGRADAIRALPSPPSPRGLRIPFMLPQARVYSIRVATPWCGATLCLHRGATLPAVLLNTLVERGGGWETVLDPAIACGPDGLHLLLDGEVEGFEARVAGSTPEGQAFWAITPCLVRSARRSLARHLNRLLLEHWPLETIAHPWNVEVTNNWPANELGYEVWP